MIPLCRGRELFSIPTSWSRRRGQSAWRQEVFFLWRPFLPDPKDDMVLELAVAAGCDAIVSYNKRDLAGAERFGVRLCTPKEFLTEIGALR